MSTTARLASAVQGARAVAAQGDTRGAFALLDEAVDRAGAQLGTDDPEVLAATGLLAKFHADLGELADARRVLEESLAAGYQRLGDGHEVMLGLAYELARIADELGNVFEAKRRYGQLVRLGPQALGDDHPSVRAARRYLGLAEQAPPVHVPHTTAPAPFDPVSPPRAAGPQIWPAEDRPVFEPHSPWPEMQPSGPPAYGPPPVSVPPISVPPVSIPPASTPPVSVPAAFSAPPSYGPPPVSTPPLYGPPPVSTPPAHGSLPSAEALPYGTTGYPASAPPASAPPASAPPASGPPASAPPASGPPASAPPWAEQEPADVTDWEPKRRSPVTALLVIALVALVGGAAAAVVAFVVARPGGTDQAAPPLATATSGPAPSQGGGPTGNPRAPTQLRLRDDRTAITLTWIDPSAGTVPFIVAGGQEGALRQLQVMPAGSTTYTINGLNPKLDYCFTVAAVYSTDSVELSDLACTNRA
ncbi:hypothetical protein ACFFX1_31925 [Dactylosporangium sucinum]|uniref:Fibronectin type-III domain-containing protein n=1 Tax=Dactylosporangium sucinum TaxID=1424081 RepID=A0A917T8V1_9ACTN|nr:hypothetical protein [Dactylosporangium sucinum]GGM13926.1 hypothetical protein GCM10007977_013730 [Dactylosporangium sucinum]